MVICMAVDCKNMELYGIVIIYKGKSKFYYISKRRKSKTAVVQRCTVKNVFFEILRNSNFAKFTYSSSGTGVSNEFCEILKNTFFIEHLQ